MGTRIQEAEKILKSLESYKEPEIFISREELRRFTDVKKRLDELATQFQEAEKELKEAREVFEVKLSDLDHEEWEACKGTWVRGEAYDGAVAEGIIINSDEKNAYVFFPKKGYAIWRSPGQLTLLPDYQRAFVATGDPVKVDPGQWAKTRGMEEEFDRLKEAESTLLAVMENARAFGIFDFGI
ncbi:hypothetical protein ACP8NE_00865 [Corynebacterium ulcerans]|uniref:hypothetical protein n=1 Tax=Corynebacterium ulcerans TaxID=65058 RepID=UPI003D6E6B51